MKSKKILVVSYLLPPMGGGGVQRITKFIKYIIQETNYKIYVIGAEDKSYYARDTILEKELSGTQIYRIKVNTIFEFFIRILRYLFKKLSKLKIPIINITEYGLFVFQYRITFIIKSLYISSKYIKKFNIETVISTSGPRENHIVGLLIKKFFNIKWITDYRDLWIWWQEYERIKNQKLRMKLEKNLASEIVNKSDFITYVSPIWMKQLFNFSQTVNRNSIILENGFDIDLSLESKIINFEKKSKIRIAYVGQFFAYRSPEYFFKALEILKEKNPQYYKKIIFDLYGPLHNFTKNIINYAECKDIINYKGYISNLQIQKEYKNIDLLLFIIGKYPYSEGTYTGKIYEYLASNVPILATIPLKGVAYNLIKKTKTGIIAEYDNPEDIYKKLILFFSDWKYEPYYEYIQTKSRFNQTKKLISILDTLKIH